MNNEIRDLIENAIEMKLEYSELKKIDKEVFKYNKLKCKLAAQEDVINELVRQYKEKFGTDLRNKEKEV
jgi:hypothetical protein